MKWNDHKINSSWLNNHISIPFSGGRYIFRISDIICCEGNGSYVNVYLNGKEDPILVCKTLEQFERRLQPQAFIRCHKSHIVNMEYITAYKYEDGGMLILSCNKCVPVSDTYKQVVIALVDMIELGN